MQWDNVNEAEVGVQPGDDESDVGVQSGDEDGRWIGQGAWVGKEWHDPIDPHPFPQRERRSREDFDLDYQPNLSQVMTTRLITTLHLLYIFIDYAYESYDPCRRL